MDVTQMQAYCLAEPGAWADDPDEDLLGDAVDESDRFVVEGLPEQLRLEGWDS